MFALKAQIIDACHRMAQNQLVANHDGNITFKLPTGGFLATPTAFSKADIEIEDLLELNQQGVVVAGDHKIFSEISWHLAIYRVRPDIKCVVHGHPPVAGGIALSGQHIGTPPIPEAIISLGRGIFSTEFLSPMDPELKKIGGRFDLEFSRVLAESDACLVPGNGAWVVGQNPLHAYLRLELVEHLAKQIHSARLLGNCLDLKSELVEELLKKRPLFKSDPMLERIEYVVRSEIERTLNSQT